MQLHESTHQYSGEIIKTTGFWGTGYVNLTLGVGEGNHLGSSRSAAVTGAATHTGNTHFRLPETLYKPNASRINLIFRLISILNKYYAKKKNLKHVLRYLMRFCVPSDDVVKVILDYIKKYRFTVICCSLHT